MSEKQLEPKIVEIGGKKFKIAKIPALAAREIFLTYVKAEEGKYVASSINSIIKLLSYCSIKIGEDWVRLETPEFIDAHITDVQHLVELEGEMMQHNFFSSAKGVS